MTPIVTVAIPTVNAGAGFAQTLAAVGAQQVECETELLVCDSGSTDGTVALARSHGARVIEIPQQEFSHGGTRNLLMSQARGDHVAFLTQDAVPATEDWLAELVGAFNLADNVGLAFGPYLPRPDASPMVARELGAWFDGFAVDGRPRIDQLSLQERDIPPPRLLGRRGFFTDANGCLARRAWEEVPFRDIPYAEDHALAHDMLRAGFAKVYVPDAAVVHSHDYGTWGWLRRAFDESRAMQGVYGWREPASPRAAARNVWGRVGADWRWVRGQPDPPSDAAMVGLLAASAVHHLARGAGAILGSRADRLPAGLTRRLSHERRAG